MDNFEFVFELNRAANALNAYIDTRIVPHAGLTRAQFVALLLIERFPDLTKASLARKLSCSHVAAGRLVAILADKGYITCTPSERNSHVLHLRVTHTGEGMIEHVKSGFKQESASLFAHAKTKVDIAVLSAQLHAFTEILSLHK